MLTPNRVSSEKKFVPLLGRKTKSYIATAISGF